jgi:hypothetical protein
VVEVRDRILDNAIVDVSSGPATITRNADLMQ